MRKLGWFHRRAAGWTPCTWQAWLGTALCLLAQYAALYWGPCWNPVLILFGAVGPLFVLLVVAALTDDTA
jgi:hypothetical protein